MLQDLDADLKGISTARHRAGAAPGSRPRSSTPASKDHLHHDGLGTHVNPHQRRPNAVVKIMMPAKNVSTPMAKMIPSWGQKMRPRIEEAPRRC